MNPDEHDEHDIIVEEAYERLVDERLINNNYYKPTKQKK
jgi:hypothetical protein